MAIERRVEIRPQLGGKTKVKLEGTDVSSLLTGYALVDTVRHGPRLRLELALTLRSQIVGAANVEVDPATAELLLSLGWTPPRDPKLDECTHGADCKLHPDANGLHNRDSERPTCKCPDAARHADGGCGS